jgi:hypothetical protein
MQKSHMIHNLTESVHPGQPRTRRRVEQIVGVCDTCQKFKLQGKGYGDLPPREAHLMPWHEVAIDLTGPWTLPVHGQDLTFQVLSLPVSIF